ncbi:TetR/AcrR family transcriptional regulator [Sphingomonas sp. IC4-52]|uniref:TetR/AcrR family transcriptional regulator n=1 Tax=Sphingomonas sp. IC4-52 TaxID=2887202 RepID=UPI001D11C531|nr:TetR/AcrR family transcriptional regulator [Sphingomonas sp. IC4-52]MCC2980678.1 TetR/AcrR family transcriptional regulator [Sphingomonas sp. IC4-52]
MERHEPDKRRSRAPRRDAQERREALIASAVLCFTAEGYRVPLDTIAERAGVGRGTLYRNFKDRDALVVAIFSREADRLEQVIDPARPLVDILSGFVLDGAVASSLFARIAADLQLDETNRAALEALGNRMERIFAPAVAAAKERGEIAFTVTPRDIVLAARMASTVMLPFLSEDEVAAQVSEALRLVFDGLRPR